MDFLTLHWGSAEWVIQYIVSKPQSQCHAPVSKYEDGMEKWYNDFEEYEGYSKFKTRKNRSIISFSPFTSKLFTQNKVNQCLQDILALQISLHKYSQ